MNFTIKHLNPDGDGYGIFSNNGEDNMFFFTIKNKHITLRSIEGCSTATHNQIHNQIHNYLKNLTPKELKELQRISLEKDISSGEEDIYYYEVEIQELQGKIKEMRDQINLLRDKKYKLLSELKSL